MKIVHVLVVAWSALILSCSKSGTAAKVQENKQSSIAETSVIHTTAEQESGVTRKRDENSPDREFTIYGVKKVFVHTPGTYSIMWRDPKSSELYHHMLDKTILDGKATYSLGDALVRVFEDAQPGQMYVVIMYFDPGDYVEIHVHIDDAGALSGGNFKYGKGGSSTGSTNVVR